MKGFIILIIVLAVMIFICKKVGAPIADSIVAPPSGYRRSYAINSITIAFILALAVLAKTGSSGLMVITFLAVSFIGYIIIRVIENGILTGTDKAYDALKGAVGSTKKSNDSQAYANNPLMRAAAEREAEEKEKADKRILREGGWKCRFCNNVNPWDKGFCSCGKSRGESKEKELSVQKDQEAIPNKKETKENNVIPEKRFRSDVRWECAFCGKVNAGFMGFCTCGKSRTESYSKRKEQSIADKIETMGKTESLGTTVATEKTEGSKLRNDARWKCAFCGKDNPGFMGFCTCGKSRAESQRENS
ncbi:MAG: hypothetical protein IJM34_03530 [Lachnospiraceae bacterium]|nr:hypothetical protein [Lachnospiraceae bacterium]